MVRAAEPPQSTGLQVPYDEGFKQIKSSPAEAIKIFRDLVLGEHPNDADSLKVKEQAVQQLGELYSKQSEAEAIRSLLTEIRPLFAAFPKARTAKLVRMLIESVAKIPDSTALQVLRVSPIQQHCMHGCVEAVIRPACVVASDASAPTWSWMTSEMLPHLVTCMVLELSTFSTYCHTD